MPHNRSHAPDAGDVEEDNACRYYHGECSQYESEDLAFDLWITEPDFPIDGQLCSLLQVENKRKGDACETDYCKLMGHFQTLEGSLRIGSLSEEHCHHEMKHVWMPDVESFRKN